MASRKEQKEALRAERERKAQEAAAAERRRRMIGFGAAGVLVVAAVAAIAVVLITSGGGDDGGANGEATPESADFVKASIPAKGDGTDLNAAAKAADCKVSQHPSEGRSHVDGRQTYKTNPPNSGDHNEFPAEDGAYTEPVAIEELVHSLEHGRVVFWYRPDGSAQLKGQLKALFDEDNYHVILAPNDRKMPTPVAASSWTRTITCPKVNDKTWDALRLFRDQYRDQAPEQVP
jgi:hypothetical protein